MAKSQLTGKCKLCGNESRLCESHILPKFASDWLKKTSATGYGRQVLDPNLRTQDTKKLRLLCKDCESLFSKLEKTCAENLFIPFVDKAESPIKYDEWLLKFAILTAWRTAMVHIEDLQNDEPILANHLDKALTLWSEFLQGKNKDHGPYEHHLFLVTYVDRVQGIDIPEYFHRYFSRALDATIAHTSKEVYVYTKLPHLVFWTCVEPPQSQGLEGTLIEKRGSFRTHQRIAQAGLCDFLFSRVNATQEQMLKMSTIQRSKVLNTMLLNPERVIKSRDYEAIQHDRKWIRDNSAK